MIDVIKGALMIAGSLLMLLAALGVVRLPDLLTRMHASTKAAVLGVSLVMMSVAIHFGEVSVVTRAFVITVFFMMTAPVAAHVIGRAGYFVGSRLWNGTVKDELKPNYDPLTHELKSGLETEANAARQRDVDAP